MNDVVVIGAGPAGLTAAIYALRAGLEVTICEKNIYGGQMSIIDTIENYPGFLKISGMDFSSTIYEQVMKLGSRFVFSEVTKVDFSGEEKCISTLSEGDICAKTVIIANGLKRRFLGCKGEREFAGRGVSYCATCDGAFFKGKSVIVIGGGNTALEDALYLSNICRKVTMLVRNDHFRGENLLVDAVNNAENIEVIFESNLKEISGKDFVESALIEGSNGDIKEISIDGVFIAIGYQPDNDLYKNKIKMNASGYFIANETCETNIPGVYVAGDCRVKPLRQIVTAMADGAVAGSAAAAFILRQISSKKVMAR